MTAATPQRRVRGHGLGTVDTVLSVDAVERAAADLAATGPSAADLDALVGGAPLLAIDDLVAGYGAMEILHGLNLRLGAGQSLCLIGPNGAGKSTVLHSIYGFTTISGGRIKIGEREVTRLAPSAKLKQAGIAYILQDSSVFPDMTVEENLWMGGFLMDRPADAHAAAEAVLARYPRLAERRRQQARVLSGGERRPARDLPRPRHESPACCSSTSPRSASSRATSTWSSRSSTTSSGATARPSSWSSRTRRRASPSPTSATSSSPAASPSPPRPPTFSTTRTWAAYS